jgi:hypothetical protein
VGRGGYTRWHISFQPFSLPSLFISSLSLSPSSIPPDDAILSNTSLTSIPSHSIPFLPFFLFLERDRTRSGALSSAQPAPLRSVIFTPPRTPPSKLSDLLPPLPLFSSTPLVRLHPSSSPNTPSPHSFSPLSTWTTLQQASIRGCFSTPRQESRSGSFSFRWGCL